MEVLMQVRGKIPAPRRMYAPLGHKDQSKFCLYHRDHGYDTEEYVQLKDEIESLIRRGKLGRFLRRPDERRHPVPQLPALLGPEAPSSRPEEPVNRSI